VVKYAESVWMKVRGERGRSALYIGCMCIHAYLWSRYSHYWCLIAIYNLRKEDVLTFKQKGMVV